MYRSTLLLTLCWLTLSGPLSAQDIFLTTLDSRLYRLDLADCSYELLSTVPPSTTDITFHPNGKLYVVSSQGRLVELNPANGMVTFVHQFTQNTFYTALTADATGRIFATGAPGLLSSYNPATGQEVYHGNIGFDAAGDLSYFNGELYMASYSDDIIRVDVANPANSSVAIDASVSGDIFGIVSYAANCSEVTTYALTNSNTDIYEINFATGTLDLYCSLPLNVGGGASTFEFFGSSPIEILELDYGDFQCAAATGFIDITAGGGVGELAYSLDSVNFQPAGTFSDLAAGQFVAYVRDANGCTAIDSLDLDLEEPVSIAVDVTPAACAEDNGLISVELLDPVAPPYTYSLQDAPFGPTNSFSALPPGDYTLRVRDNNGCERVETVGVEAAPPPVIDNVSLVDTRCGADDGSVTLAVSEGRGPIRFGATGLAEQSTPSFSGLAAGTYTVFVADADACRDSVQVSIAASEAPRIVDLITDTVGCLPAGAGTLSVLAAGGAGNYAYQLGAGSDFSPSASFANLQPGQYQVVVRDADDCFSDPATIVIEADPSPVLTVGEVTPAGCGRNDGSLFPAGSGGTGTLRLAFDGQFIALAQPQTELAAGDYALVLSDELGCRDSLTVTVPAADCPIYLPTAFSPNEDGYNDVFLPRSASELSGTVLQFSIYDRWGGELYRREDLAWNEPRWGWNGRARGQAVPAGTYLFVLVLRTDSGQVLRESGEFVLLR